MRRISCLIALACDAIYLSIAAFAPTHRRNRNHDGISKFSRYHLDASSASADDYMEFNSSSWRPGRPPLRRPLRSPIARQDVTEESVVSIDNATSPSSAALLTAHEQALQDPALLSSTNVTQVVQSPMLLRALRERGIRQLTQVQQQTYAPILDGRSLCARSKTGSGKTLAFLLPVLDRLLASDRSKPPIRNDRLGPGSHKMKGMLPRSVTHLIDCEESISVLILVPTRELGLQIAEQAQALLVHHPRAVQPGGDLLVQCVHGGTSMARDRRCLAKQLPLVLVATPGRLLDHLAMNKGDPTRVKGRKFSDILEINTLILDEADKLLVGGFQKEMKQILAALPRAEKRQTLLFSATLPQKLRQGMDEILSDDYIHIDCTEGQNDRIDRSFLKLQNMEYYSSSLIAILRHEMQVNPHHHKILVFFPTARLVRFYANVFEDVLRMPVLEIHSRMSQSSRNKAYSDFTRARRSIMFTSDVSARGIDYPDVSLVLQFGAPFSLTLNTHRTGRTARAGRRGEALMVILPFESPNMLKMVKGCGYKESTAPYNINSYLEDVSLIRSGVRMKKELTVQAESAYISFIAYYSEYGGKNVSAAKIINASEVFAKDIGLKELPELPAKLRMSLKKR